MNTGLFISYMQIDCVFILYSLFILQLKIMSSCHFNLFISYIFTPVLLQMILESNSVWHNQTFKKLYFLVFHSLQIDVVILDMINLNWIERKCKRFVTGRDANADAGKDTVAELISRNKAASRTRPINSSEEGRKTLIL